jgi:hypothetical protein
MTSAENQAPEENLLTVLENLIEQQKRFNELLEKLARRVDELSALQLADHATVEMLTARLGIARNAKPD